MSSIELFQNKTDCCGCSACYNVCPRKAISMQEDEYGYVYPVIDQDKCVGCGLCRKVCHYQADKELRTPIKAYAAAGKKEEFLKKGIAITQNIQEHKGLYPLGYNLTPSLGFGSFCATDLNISNTCPIVLWWGNVIEKGNELDCWYPLLPRRISAKDINPFDADWTLQEAEDDGYDDVFDTCPDCGCGISLRNDGGNGFCIDCAWNH